jgi:hypothetical protein
VLGTVSSTTIKATQVIVQTTEGVSTASTAATVIPFQKVAPTTSKQVGKIPANYSEGSGTIVSERQRIRRRELHWRPTQEALSTVS